MSAPDLGSVMAVDLSTLTIADIEAIEEITGLGMRAVMTRLADDDAPKGKLLRAIAYVAMRRTDPSVTFEDAGAVVLEIQDDRTVDPTSASAS